MIQIFACFRVNFIHSYHPGYNSTGYLVDCPQHQQQIGVSLSLINESIENSPNTVHLIQFFNQFAFPFPITHSKIGLQFRKQNKVNSKLANHKSNQTEQPTSIHTIITNFYLQMPQVLTHFQNITVSMRNVDCFALKHCVYCFEI